MSSTHAGIAHQPRGQNKIEYLLLEEVKVKAWVVDVSSRIVLAQTFYNPSNEPTGKAKYVFPLPASAAVCAFQLEIENGVVIVGEVKVKEEAELTYTRAVEQGKAAALVERVTDDIFTISLGSLPATTRVIAHLTFVMDLLDEGLHDRIRLQLPMHIAQRYGTPPPAMHDTSAADSRTRVDINVDIQTSDVIYGVDSPTHTIEVRRYKGRSGVKSSRRMSAVWKSHEFLDTDFVVSIHAEGLDKPRCFAEETGNSFGPTVAIQLTLVPKFLAPKIPAQEYIFVIDRSGSMSGTPIETAKRTLTMLLRLLPSRQTVFNIFSFGTNVTSLWVRGGRGLDTNSLSEATSHVASMGADYGGTEVPSALQSAFNSRRLDRPAVVFLLTDGDIHSSTHLDPYVVVANAVQTSPPLAPTRLFVLGIGGGVSSDVCSRLARQGNGEALFAVSAEAIYGKCARLLNAGRSKNIQSVDVDWGCDASSFATLPSASAPSLPTGITALGPPPFIQQAPHSLTNIFSGIRFTVFAITSSGTVPSFVKLITKLDGEPNPQELRVPVTKVKPFHDTHEDSIIPIVHTLAARKLVMALDDGVGPLPTPAPGDALLASQDDLRKAGIVRLGLTYQLITQHTSFVAVQKGDERTRSREHESSSKAWMTSRLSLDGFLDDISSFMSSLFGFSGNPVAPSRGSHPRSHHQSGLPGAFGGSDSGESESGRGRSFSRPASPPRRRSVSSQRSTDTFSSLSSLEESSCSSCWTASRPPSPLPQPHDPTARAPSPDFQRDPSAGSHRPTVAGPGGVSNKPHRVSNEVFGLFLEMELEGSFSATPLLTRLVGDVVLSKGDEKGIDRRVWATVVAAAYMKENLQGEPDMVDLVTEKAKEFVEAFYGAGGNGTPRSFDELVRLAVGLLNVDP